MSKLSRRSIFSIFGVVCLLYTLSSPLFADTQDNTAIGAVKHLKGEVLIQRGGESLIPKNGDSIKVGDLLETHENSGIGMTFKDNSILVLGKESKMVINQFDYEEESSRTASFTYIAGVFNLKMTKMNGLPDDVQVQIPGGTIKALAADFFGGYLDREFFDVALLGTGLLQIQRGDLNSVIRIPGFGAQFPNEGNDPVKPKRLTPERIQMMQDAIRF